MLTLEDINKLPNDPTEKHLRSLDLLPQPAPAPSIIPAAGKIPAPSLVTAPAPGPTADWRTKLAATVPHPVAPTTALPPLSPATTPEMGTGAPQPAVGPLTPLAGENPQLPTLNFKERQALPTTSEGVAPGSKESFEAQLARMQEEKENPWGSPENHPGILGKIGHYASKIGNIAGDIIAPATMANIPGTDLNKKIEERGLQEKVSEAGKEREKEKTGESERELRSAETEEAKARAAKLGAGNADILQDAGGNAVGWRDEKGGLHSLDEEGTPANIKAIAEKWEGKSSAKPQKENLEQGLAGAVQEAIDNDRDPESDTKVQGWAKAIKDYKPSKDTDVKTVEDLKHRIVMAMESGDVKKSRELQQELNATDPEGMARLADAQARMAATAEDRAEHVREHKETREDKEEKEGRTMVRVRDEKTGQTYVEPLAKAKADGVPGASMEEVPAAEKTPIQDARLVMKVLSKKGDKPESKGVLQLIDELDKEGKLGVVNSRLNSFLAGGVGTLPGDDPRIMSLLDKADLAMTLSMKAHFGVSGGRSPQMLEHFLNLANAKKMDGPALKAGFRAVNDYMKDRAEMPPSAGGGEGGGGSRASGTQIHKGFEYTKGADGQWHKRKAVQP